MTEKLMMTGLPDCLVCHRKVRRGVLFLEDDYLWRYGHGRCVVLDDDALWTAIPWTFEAWITLTIRLIDQIGATKLFDATNWRDVLECVVFDRVDLINTLGDDDKEKVVVKRRLRNR